jgi:hypothetical protein
LGGLLVPDVHGIEGTRHKQDDEFYMYYLCGSCLAALPMMPPTCGGLVMLKWREAQVLSGRTVVHAEQA